MRPGNKSSQVEKTKTNREAFKVVQAAEAMVPHLSVQDEER
jgi:hypothetical protein